MSNRVAEQLLIAITITILIAITLHGCEASENTINFHSEYLKRVRRLDFDYVGGPLNSVNVTFDDLKLLSGSLAYKFYKEWQNIAVSVSGKAQEATCFQQLNELVTGFGSQDGTSLRFFDSWGKIPAGIAKGHFVEMGNFDECVDIKTLLADKSYLLGKYCFANFPLAMTDFYITVGVCMPAACTAQEFDIFLKIFLNSLLGLDFSGTGAIVGESSCSVREQPSFSAMDWVCCVIFVLLGCLMLLSSIYDCLCKAVDKKPQPLLAAFSVQANIAVLLAVKPNVQSPNVIPCLNGIRCLSLIWVICGHTFESLLGSPSINSGDILAWGRTAFSQIIQRGIFSVDTFFFLSGFLLSFIGLRDIERNKGRLNVPMMYVHRILRLTPMLAMAVLFAATLAEYLATAPIWPIIVSNLSDTCKEKWWTTLLYVQNYVNPERMCFPHAWYLAVDTQLYVISPIFLLALWKWQKKGAAFVGIVALLFVACLFSIIMVREFSYHTNGLYIADPVALQKTYYATHGRTSPWFIGLLFGYFMHMTKNRRITLPKVLVLMGWLVSFALLATVIFAFYSKAHNALAVSVVEEAFYWSLSRVAWPTALCWIVFACVNGYGGLINEFLSCPLWQPLARLSYSMYIWHMVMVISDVGRIKTNLYFSNYDGMLRFWGDFGWSLLLSTLMYLALEAPLVSIEKLLLPNPNKAKPTKTTVLPVEPVGHAAS